MKKMHVGFLVLTVIFLVFSGCSHMPSDEGHDKVLNETEQAESRKPEIQPLEKNKDYEGEVVRKTPHAVFVAVDKDLDGDGVTGRADKCPGTPIGAPVNDNGCWVIPHVLFKFDTASLTAASAVNLEKIASVLADNPSISLSVQGHTCNLGPDAFNMALSMKRAEAVKKFIVDKCIANSRMVVIGFSANRPVAPNDAKLNRSLNRRVELKRSDD